LEFGVLPPDTVPFCVLLLSRHRTLIRWFYGDSSLFPRGQSSRAPGKPVAPMMLSLSIMLIAGLIIAGFAVTGVVLGMFVAKTAPVGYQDEKGFHFGAQQSVDSYAFDVHHAKAA